MSGKERKEATPSGGGRAGRKASGRLKTLILAALVAGLAFGFTRLDESKKRFILHLVKQVPYLPGRYYA